MEKLSLLLLNHNISSAVNLKYNLITIPGNIVKIKVGHSITLQIWQFFGSVVTDTSHWNTAIKYKKFGT
jgi:hypothetical protein